MELWLLGAGALVLVGIALWIVWPARSADPVGISVGSKEVIQQPMTETGASALPPQGDRFEDQYTSATADLSPGGVAAAVGSMQEPPGTPETPGAHATSSSTTQQTPTTPASFPTGTYGAAPFNATASGSQPAEPSTGSSLMQPRSMGIGAGALLAVAGGIGGAWLYARWQRERNRPINRLRRSARDMASRLGERIPDVDDLPLGPAPMSGAATALLLTALVASRALRRDSDDTARDVRGRANTLLRNSATQAIGRGRDAVKVGTEQSRKLQARISSDAPSVEDARKPGIMGIGLGGMAIVAGGAYAIWRVLQRGQSDRSKWYAGE